MPPLLADFTHARPCKPFCEKYLTLPTVIVPSFLSKTHCIICYYDSIDGISVSRKRRHKNKATQIKRVALLFLYIFIISRLFLEMVSKWCQIRFYEFSQM